MEHHEQDDEQVSPEVRERAVRMVLDNAGRHESRWRAIVSVAAKIGCSANTLNDWVKRAEVDSGRRAGVTTEMMFSAVHERGRLCTEITQTRYPPPTSCPPAGPAIYPYASNGTCQPFMTR